MKVFAAKKNPFSENPLMVQKIRELVARKMGMVINDDDLSHFMVKVRKRISTLGFETIAEYHNLLVAQRTSDPEWQELLELILIKETTFFRNPMQFQSLKNQILPELMEKHRKSVLRIWVAGSSTGEEAYTLAIILKEAQNEMMTDLKFQILATDLSYKSLEHAAKGVYSSRSVRGVPQHLQSRYFTPIKDGFVLSDQIKSTVDLRYQNLVENTWPPYMIGKWDIIFCRNVIIYFKPRTIQTLIDRFYEMLNDNGYFFAGHSENIGIISEKFKPIELNGVFIYQKEPFKYIAKETPDIRLSNKVLDSAISKLRAPEQDRASENKRPAVRHKHAGITSAEEKAADHAAAKERRHQGLSLCTKARELFKTDDCRKALMYLDRVIELDPGISDAYLIRAQILTDHGDLVKARENCIKTMELTALSAPAYFVLGLIELKENKMSKADDAFKKCVYIDPEFAPAYFQMSQIAQSRGDNKAALLHINNALKAFKTTEHRLDITDYSAGFSRQFLIKACEVGKLNLEKTLNG